MALFDTTFETPNVVIIPQIASMQQAAILRSPKKYGSIKINSKLQPINWHSKHEKSLILLLFLVTTIKNT